MNTANKNIPSVDKTSPQSQLSTQNFQQSPSQINKNSQKQRDHAYANQANKMEQSKNIKKKQRRTHNMSVDHTSQNYKNKLQSLLKDDNEQNYEDDYENQEDEGTSTHSQGQGQQSNHINETSFQKQVKKMNNIPSSE
eukprot:403354613